MTSKCLNFGTKKVQYNLHLKDTQEVHNIHSFNQSPFTTQSFIADCASSRDTSDSCSNSDDFVCEIQEQSATSISKTKLNANLIVSTSAYSKPLYVRCRLDTTADVNVIPISVYKNLFHDYSLNQLGPVQANIRMYNSTNMTVIEYVLYITTHKL